MSGPEPVYVTCGHCGRKARFNILRRTENECPHCANILPFPRILVEAGPRRRGVVPEVTPEGQPATQAPEEPTSDSLHPGCPGHGQTREAPYECSCECERCRDATWGAAPDQPPLTPEQSQQVAAVVGDEDYPISEKSTTVVTEVKPEPLEPEDEEGVDFDL